MTKSKITSPRELESRIDDLTTIVQTYLKTPRSSRPATVFPQVPTLKQLAVLAYYKIPHSSDTSRAEAFELIRRHYAGRKKR